MVDVDEKHLKHFVNASLSALSKGKEARLTPLAKKIEAEQRATEAADKIATEFTSQPASVTIKEAMKAAKDLMKTSQLPVS